MSVMDIQILRPAQETLESKGRLSYSEGSQAWSIIKLKKELLQEFPQLREKRSSFSYRLMLFRSYKKMEKAIKEIQKKEQPLPLLLCFYKEPSREDS